MHHYFHFLNMFLKFGVGLLELIINIQCGELTVAFCYAATIANDLSPGDGKEIALLTSQFLKHFHNEKI